MTSSPAQLRYLADTVNTASPVRLLVMLYDRLVLDIRRAADAQEASEQIVASEQLRHAQQIVAELLTSLRMQGWDGAENLASLYGFILGELIAVNLTPSPARLRAVEQIVSDLRDSWREAALTVLEATKVAPPADADAIDAPVRHIAWVG
ncbi:flagellar export chaperone FliS [Jatrophihabitans sp. DSM 45814]